MQFLKRLYTPTLLQRIAFVAAAALLWFLPDICRLSPPNARYDFTFLNHFVWFSLPAFWAHFVQFWVLIALAVWLETICHRYRVLNVRSSMLFLLLPLLAACSVHLQFFDASTVAFALTIYAVAQLLSMYNEKRECVGESFKIGLALTCAAAFDRAYIWLVLVLIVGMIIFSTLSLRTLCTFVVGLLMPVLLLVECFLLADAWPTLAQALTAPLFIDAIRWPSFAWSEWGLIAVLAGTTVIAVGNYVASNTIYSLNVRLNYTFYCIALVLTLLLSALIGWYGPRLLLPLLFSTLALSFYFTNNHNRAAHIIFIALIACCSICRIVALLGF